MLDAQFDLLSASDPEIEEDPRDKDSREHGGEDTQAQGYSKTPNGSRSELIKDDGRNNGGQVGVKNGQSGPGVPFVQGFNGRTYLFAVLPVSVRK